MIDSNSDEMRCMFAAFALQGLMSSIDPEILENQHNRRFIAEAAFDAVRTL